MAVFIQHQVFQLERRQDTEISHGLQRKNPTKSSQTHAEGEVARFDRELIVEGFDWLRTEDRRLISLLRERPSNRFLCVVRVKVSPL